MSAPVERTTRLATSVDDLTAAFAFVMAHVDEVGPDPEIRITPFWRVTSEDESPRAFSVMVSGMVPEAAHV